MTCGGCSGAVTRALGKVEGEYWSGIWDATAKARAHAGLDSFEVSLEKQTVIVHPTTATYDEVLEKIKKTGKEVCMLILRVLRAVGVGVGSCLTILGSAGPFGQDG